MRISTSMPTKSPFSSVNSKGLKTVSMAITHVLSEEAAVSEASASSSAASALSSSAGASVVSSAAAAESSVVSVVEDPQATAENARHAISAITVNFFIIVPLLFFLHKQVIHAQRRCYL